ncbi:hypothetical protein, partial [Mycoplasma nasistruthionis]|uniref:hypothetical protein n=1 Tax=Mycoplasma nasistruthionis TaxID=353852 RepID=UPI001ABF4844
DEFEKVKALKQNADQINALQNLSQQAKDNAKTQLLNNYGANDKQTEVVNLAKAKDALLNKLATQNWPNLTKDSHQNQIEALTSQQEVSDYQDKLDSLNEKANLDRLLVQIVAQGHAEPLVRSMADPSAIGELEKVAQEALKATPENNLPTKEVIVDHIKKLQEAFEKVQRPAVTDYVRKQKTNNVDNLTNLTSENVAKLKDLLTEAKSPALENIIETDKKIQELNNINQKIHDLPNLSPEAKQKLTDKLVDALANNNNLNDVLTLATTQNDAVKTVKDYDANSVPSALINKLVNDIESTNSPDDINPILVTASDINNTSVAIKDSKITQANKAKYLSKISEDPANNAALRNLVNRINEIADAINGSDLKQTVKDTLLNELFNVDDKAGAEAVLAKFESELEKAKLEQLIQQVKDYQLQNPAAYQYANPEFINDLKASVAIAETEVAKSPLSVASHLKTLVSDLTSAFEKVQEPETKKYLASKLENQIDTNDKISTDNKALLKQKISDQGTANVSDYVDHLQKTNNLAQNIEILNTYEHLASPQREIFTAQLIEAYGNDAKQQEILAFASAKNDLIKEIRLNDLINGETKEELVKQAENANTNETLENTAKANFEKAKDSIDKINETSLPAEKRDEFINKVKANKEPNENLVDLVKALNTEYQNVATSVVDDQRKEELANELLSLTTKPEVEAFAKRLQAENEKVYLQDLIKLVEAYPNDQKTVYDAASPEAKTKLQQVLEIAKQAVNSTPLKTVEELKEIKNNLTTAFAGVERAAVTDYVRNKYQEDLNNSGLKETVKNALKQKVSDTNAPTLENLIEEHSKIKTVAEKIKYIDKLPFIVDSVEEKLEKELLDQYDNPANQSAIVTLASSKNRTIELIESKPYISPEVKKQLKASALVAENEDPDLAKIKSDAEKINHTGSIIHDSNLTNERKSHFGEKVSTNLINNKEIEDLVLEINSHLDALDKTDLPEAKKEELKAVLMKVDNLTQVEDFVKLLEAEVEKHKLQLLVNQIDTFKEQNALDYQNADPEAIKELERLLPLAKADLKAADTKDKEVYADHIRKLTEQFNNLQSDAVIKFTRDKLTNKINNSPDLTNEAKQALIERLSNSNSPTLKDLVDKIQDLNNTIANLQATANKQLSPADLVKHQNQILDNFNNPAKQTEILDLVNQKHDEIQKIESTLVGKEVKPEIIKSLREKVSQSDSAVGIKEVDKQLQSVKEVEELIKNASIPEVLKAKIFNRNSTDIESNDTLKDLINHYQDKYKEILNTPLPKAIKDNLIAEVTDNNSKEAVDKYLADKSFNDQLVKDTYPNVPAEVLKTLTGSDKDVALANFLNKIDPEKLDLKSLSPSDLTEFINNVKSVENLDKQTNEVQEFVNKLDKRAKFLDAKNQNKINSKKYGTILWIALSLVSFFAFVLASLLIIFKHKK